jgi:hypothetical protein
LFALAAPAEARKGGGGNIGGAFWRSTPLASGGGQAVKARRRQARGNDRARSIATLRRRDMFGNGRRRGVGAEETRDRPHHTRDHAPNRWPHCIEPNCRRHRLCVLGPYCVNPRQPLVRTPAQCEVSAGRLLRRTNALARRMGIDV